MPTESKYFPDKDFPMFVRPDSTSFIDNIDDGKSEIHEALEIKYYYEGRATLIIGSDAVEVEAGDIVVMNPYEFHATVDFGSEPARYHLIMVGLDFFPSFPELCDVRGLLLSENKAFVNKISSDAELSALILKLVAEWNGKGEMYKVRIRGIMTEVLSLFIRYGMRTIDGEREHIIRYHAAIEPALRLIRNEFMNPLTLDRLSVECCVNKSYFCRIFKEAMGKTPMQYLCDYRINRADILLRNTDRSTSDIITECGFGDESYFYRCYKKYFGFTPNRRRKDNKI